MTPTPEVQERIRRYLLGQLSDGAWEEFEQELLVDDELLEELLVLEDELNDEYLMGELPGDERVQFEQHFLAAPERQEKLRFARALNRYVTVANRQELDRKTSPSLWSNWTVLYRAGAVFAVVILFAGTVWFFLNRRSSPQIPESPAMERSAHTFATLNLTISQSTRGEGAQASKVTLPLGKDALKIVLRLPDQSPTAARYRVELESGDGEKKSLETIAQDGQSITVVIPAGELKRDLYSLKVFTVRADGGEQRINGNYFFAVE
jgi:hypothetical protein